MLTLLLSLLSSSGFGSILGLSGGILNRLLDIKSKNSDREFELKKMDKEREFMKEEYANRIQVATTEAEGRLEVAGYAAMEGSYNYARTTSEDGFVDKVSKVIRPLLTLLFFLLTVYIFYKIHTLMAGMDAKPSPQEVYNIWKMSIEWIFFQAGVSIGWWFAMRPGKVPNFGGR